MPGTAFADRLEPIRAYYGLFGSVGAILDCWGPTPLSRGSFLGGASVSLIVSSWGSSNWNWVVRRCGIVCSKLDDMQKKSEIKLAHLSQRGVVVSSFWVAVARLGTFAASTYAEPGPHVPESGPKQQG